MKRISESRMRDLVRGILIESEIADENRQDAVIRRLLGFIAKEITEAMLAGGFNPGDNEAEDVDYAAYDLGHSLLEESSRIKGFTQAIAVLIAQKIASSEAEILHADRLEIATGIANETVRAMVNTIFISHSYGVSGNDPTLDLGEFVDDVVEDRLAYMLYHIDGVIGVE